MARLQLTADIEVVNPQTAFGLMVTPPFNIHDDFDVVFDDQAFEKADAYIDKNASVLMGKPRPWVQGTFLAAWSDVAPAGTTWHDDILDPATGQNCLLMDDATAGVTFHVQTPAPFTTRGYYVKLVRGYAAAEVQKRAENIYWLWRIFIEGVYALRIVARYGQPFQLEWSEDAGVSWQVVRTSLDVDDCEAYLDSHSRTIQITIIPVLDRNTISIYINDDVDLSFKRDDLSEIVADTWYPRLDGKNGKISFAWFPMAFPLVWGVSSASKQLGFTPITTPRSYVWPDGSDRAPWPPGTDVQIQAAQDPDGLPTEWFYAIAATAPAYVGFDNEFSLVTPMLQFAQVDFPKFVVYDTTDMPSQLRPRRVFERHFFNPVDLTVQRSFSIWIDNQDAFYSKMAGANVGVRAVSLASGWNGLNALSMVGWLGETLVYDRADPRKRSELRLDGFDRSFPLQRRRCGVLPAFDGWCIYSALRFLAGVGGVDDVWMEELPNCQTGPRPPNCPHYQLPLGSGVRPRVKADVNDSLWGMMVRLCKLKRAVLGFSYEGQLLAVDYDPFELPEYVNPYTGVVTPFSPQPLVNAFGTVALQEMVGGIETTISVADVRSSATLVGIDPQDWSSLLYAVNRDFETGIVFDPTDPAFLGFYDGWYDQDPIYTDLVFMQEVANRAAAQCAIPVVDTAFGTWLQTSLGILQRVYVYEPITLGPFIQPMYTTSVVHDYSANEGKTYSGTTKVMAKLLFNP